jgi:uncharacterized protein YjhX (UPF0386 family)
MAPNPDLSVNISKPEQRTLHALAQGGKIVLVRTPNGDLADAECLTREGWRLAECTLALFRKLKRRGFIASRDGGPYGITREGLFSLRPQLDNRVSARRW